MKALYIKLVFLEQQIFELRYSFNVSGQYETQRINISIIENLIQKSKGSYYMLLPDPKRIGLQLFNWLDGDARWLSRAINNCCDEGLILALDVSERLGHLPWETLHDGTQFLVERFSPVVVPIRWVEGQTSRINDIPRRPLKLLFMATSPNGIQPVLDFEQEEAQILKITEDLPLDLRVEESGCIKELEKLLGRYQEPFDVFHLSGHAAISNDEPFFWTETDIGEAYKAKPSEISKALRFRRPSLVFLSGCHTGEASDNGALASFAELLVKQGIHAVLGWGRAIPDHVATQTAAHLYSKLAAGYHLSESLLETYQYLREEQINDWHLLRLYAHGEALGALVEPLGDQVWLPREAIHEQFLDVHGLVRVATPDEFVGRRRILQRCLKSLRSAGKLGVLLYGLGGVGKSTVAARLLERLSGYEEIFIYRQLDEDKLLRELANQCTSEIGQEILQGGLPLTQKLAKYLREGLNQKTQCFLFILDDFEANMEFRSDGHAVLKTECFPVITALLIAIRQSQIPHKIIITSRYDIPLSEFNQKLHREPITALTGADLQKKCSRLDSFGNNSEIDRKLQQKAIEESNGNPRLLEWFDKILKNTYLNQDEILDKISQKSEEFRESILVEEILSRQPTNLRRMLSFCLVYEFPVPKSAIKIICPSSFNVDEYILRAMSAGLLDCINDREERLYYVPRILEPLLDFPKDSLELYQTAANHLDKIWSTSSFFEVMKDIDNSSRSSNKVLDSYSIDRLLELYRLATQALDPGLLTRVNWPLVMYFSHHRRDREVITLCKFVMNGAFGHLGIHLVSANILHYLAISQERLGEGEKALKNYQGALDIAMEQCKNTTDSNHYHVITRNNIMHNLSSLYEKRGNYSEAIDLCLQVIESDENIDNKPGLIKALNCLALLQRKVGRQEESLKTSKRALSLAEQENDANMFVVINQNLATLKVELGETNAWDQLHEDIRNHTDIYGSKDLDSTIALLANDAAFKLRKQGTDAARESYLQLEDLLPNIENADLQSTLMHNLATFYSECNELEKASFYYKKALSMHRSNVDKEAESETLKEMGVFYRKQGLDDKALSLLQKSYNVAFHIGREDIQLEVLILITGILLNQNHLEEAIKKHNQAWKLSKATKIPSKNTSLLIQKGIILIKQEEYNEAWSILNQALESSRQGVDVVRLAVNLQLLGEVEVHLYKIESALHHFHKSLDIYRKLKRENEIKEVQTLIHLATYLKASIKVNDGEIESAIGILREGLSLVKESDNQDLAAKFLLSLGSLLIEIEILEEGFQKSSNAIEIIESGNILGDHKDAIDIVLQQQYIALQNIFESAQSNYSSGLINEAIKQLQLMLELLEIVGDEPGKISPLSMLGQLKARQGEYENGIEILNKSLVLVEEHHPELIDELQNTINSVNEQQAARLYHHSCGLVEIGNNEEALSSAQNAYKFHCSIGYQNSQCACATLCLIGQLLISKNRQEEAFEKLSQSLSIAQELVSMEWIEHIQSFLNALDKEL